MKNINKMAIFLLIIVILSICLGGCAEINAEDEKMKNQKQNLFEITYYERLEGEGMSIEDEMYIIKDKKTGREFLLYKGYRKAGITPYPY